MDGSQWNIKNQVPKMNGLIPHTHTHTHRQTLIKNNKFLNKI